MKIIKTARAIREISLKAKLAGRAVGFVPTMGALHEGHLSLIKQACCYSDIVVVSIFVNPLQFGPNEDLKIYPRQLQRDITLIKALGVDFLFAPSVDEMYPAGASTLINVGELGSRLCGRARPGHFNGVATVVAKLFNIVQPDLAFFGEKDFQQLTIIKKLVKDLNFPVNIISVPTVREKDGLAMSSRNAYLGADERRAAGVIYRSLKLARKMAMEGERSAKKISAAMKALIYAVRPRGRIDYITICDPPTLNEKSIVKGKALVAIACYFGKTRLIDNIFIGS